MRKKWMVAATVLPALVFVTLFLLGRETLQAEITIEATSEEVWSVLTDAQGLPTGTRRSASRSRSALPLPWLSASTERTSGHGEKVWRVA